MLAEQHNGLPKVRIAQGRRRDKEDAFPEWSFHNGNPTALTVGVQARLARLAGRVDLVHLVSLVQPNKPNRPNKPEQQVCFVLAIEGFASIAEQIVVRREGFVPRVGRIDLDDTEFFLVPRRAMQNRPAWSDDFAVPNKRQLIFAASGFAPCAITRNREHSIFQASNRHGVRAIG
jgi:hypothetical protein